MLVYSSHGTIEIDDDGKPVTIAAGAQGARIKIGSGIAFLFTIERFDLEEYRKTYSEEMKHDPTLDDPASHTEFDILDLGYWHSSGEYEPPMREAFEMEARKRRHIA